MEDIRIRVATAEDCPRILELMRELAAFEGYLDAFAVTLDSLRQHYLEQQHIGILAAELNDNIEGILVYFFQPFTYDLTPWMIVKELYVSQACRGLSAGQKLMLAAKDICQQRGGSKMKWEVLTDNLPARNFYEKLGATIADEWRSMSLRVSPK